MARFSGKFNSAVFLLSLKARNKNFCSLLFIFFSKLLPLYFYVYYKVKPKPNPEHLKNRMERLKLTENVKVTRKKS